MSMFVPAVLNYTGRNIYFTLITHKALGTYTSMYSRKLEMSHIMRKPAFCICKNKGADQLHGKCPAGQHIFATYIAQSLYFLNPKFQASSNNVLAIFITSIYNNFTCTRQWCFKFWNSEQKRIFSYLPTQSEKFWSVNINQRTNVL